MTSRVSTSNPTPSALRLSTVATSTRKARRANFGDAMKSGFLRAGRAAETGLRVASPLLPVGGVISAALAGSTAAAGPDAVAVQARGLGAADALSPAVSGGPASGPNGMFEAASRMTEMNASYNLRYLQLQQQIQADTRQFQLVSNVLKTKHDAAKNAVNNIR